MNQEEDVPTRVTRGALRRRSIDQDATPQNPQGTGTSVAGGTPKKAASAAKKGSTLGAIQESQGRPSTPVGGGRGGRRRMSETIDTPTAAPNKLVQSLKDSESVVGSGPGRRSRNTSLTLTEENVQELNVANEGTGATVRTRTPARLRASHETLTSTTPQTAPTGVRRSTRRNSVTSDDGSVQSLPITTPKTPIGRPLKVEPIVEEDMTGGDRAGSDSSPRNTPGRSSTPGRAVSQSPRREAPSPLLTVKQEMTPPRGSVSPQQSSSSAKKPPNSTPRSKNVSFTDDSKQEDSQSGYPKTPTSPGKKFVLVGVNDLRNTQLINGTPKANAVIVLGGSEEKAGTARNEQVTAKESPTVPAVGGDAAGNDAPAATAEVEENEKKDTETIAPSSATENVDASTPADSAVPLNISSSIVSADRTDVAAANEVSGIDVLESSVLEDVVNTSNVSNGQTTEGEPFSKYWSHSVRGTTTKGIDAFSVRKQEEKKAEEEQKNLDASLQRSSKTPEKKRQPSAPETDEEEDDDDERNKRHEFVDDEAMEVDGYQSGDSLDAEIRQEMAENDIAADQGEDLGTDDTEEDVEDGEQEDENDSFIVTDDDEEELDEDALLAGTGDDLSTDGSPVKTPKEKTPSHRRRIVQMVDYSEEEEEEEEGEEEAKKHSTPTSSERSTSERKRSVRQLTTTDEEASPEKKPNRAVMTEDEEEEESAVVVEGKAELVDEQKRTPEKLDNNTSAEKTTPANAGKPSKTETPSKAADVSGKSVPKSPGQSVDGSDSSFVEVFLDEKTDVSGASVTKEDEESKKTPGKSVSFEATSRKSLPPVTSSKESGKTVARKSLPAGTKMHFVEEMTTEELHPSTSNLEASYQEEEDDIEDEKLQKEKQGEKTVAKNGVDQEGAEKASSNTVTSDEEYYEASESVDEGAQTEQQGQKHVEGKQAASDKEAVTEEQSVAPVKPARKPLLAAPLISAQFYLGGSKKEKRNTLAEGEEVTVGVTSTPNQKPSAKKNKKGAVSTNLVANPFALTSAKAKTRLSMDSAVAEPAGDPDVAVQTMRKNRNSLPVMKLDAANSKSNAITSIEKEAEVSPQQQPPLDEPEPMEVDESVDDEGEAEDRQPEQKGAVEVKSKTPKKKPKALTEFDLESILTRCNEVVRADKERKKQLATLAQQKRDEKRRLRELREQQEKLESTEGNGEGQPQRNDGADVGTKSNITTSANEESIEQPSSDDPAKKKKKRKKKIKNYVLEELAELKKDRVSEALLRKMEANEERKQRKKERRAEKMKLLNKENGDVRGGAPDGIGAKLEKVAKKKQKQRMENAAAEEALKQQPSVRVAVSAFAVFQQLQNGHTTLQPALDVPLGGGDGKKHTKVADGDAPPVAKSVERQEPLGAKSKEPVEKLEKKKSKKLHPEDAKETTVVVDVQPKVEPSKVVGKKKEKQPDEPKKTPEEKKPSKENPSALVAKTPTADDVSAFKKKKKKAEGKAAAVESAEVQKAASESQLGQREPDVSAEKLKRKQKKADAVAAPAVDVVFAAPEVAPLPQEETRKAKKQKKNKVDKMAASVEEDSKTEVELKEIAELKPPKEKKRVPAAEFFHVPEAAEPEPLPQEETRKTKKQKKNKADKIVVPVGEEEQQDTVEPLPPKESKTANKKGALGKASVVNGGLEKKKLGTSKPKEEESIVASALREIRTAFNESEKNKKASKDKKGKKKEIYGTQDDAVVVASADPPKKRKRDPIDGSSTSSTPRPTKLRALQRADLGFVEETVTPDKTRLKRNFGFEEMQATPKAVGFKVSSLLPSDDLRTLADDSIKAGKRKKLKKAGTVPEPNRSLPLPVWTRSGYFIEVPDKESSERPKKKSTQEGGKIKPNATAVGVAASSYIPLKGHEGFKLGTLRGMPNGGGASSSVAAATTTTKPHRINPDTVAPSVVNFKRQQLLEKTAHLREKKKGG